MAVAFVRHVGSSVVTTGTTGVVTVPAAGCQVGDVLVCRIAHDFPGGTVSSVVDTGGNTYTQLHASNAVDPTVFVWVGDVTTALVLTNTITVTFSGSGSTNVAIDEFSGVSATEDGTSAAAGGTSTTPSVTMTPNTVGLMIGLMVMKDPTTATITEDADTTNGSWVSFTVVNNVDLKTGGAYKILSASGAQTYNPTLSASRLWDSIGCALHLFDDNFARHIRMQRTKIAIVACPSECETVFVAGIESGRMEELGC